jgi:hypothetical protein
MHNGCMSNDAVFPNDTGIALIGMQNRIVLDIAPCPHPDLVGIAAQNRAKPHAGLIAQNNIANYMRTPGNKHSITFNR